MFELGCEKFTRKGQSFYRSNAAFMKDGNSDLETVSDWSPGSSQEAPGDLEIEDSFFEGYGFSKR